MKNLKFRAWHKELKQMRQAEEIKFINWPESGHVLVMPDAGQAWVSWPSKRIEVMQFTGLTDADGKEIYEDDIVQIDRLDSFPSFNIGHVVFHHGAFMLLDKKEAPKLWNTFDIAECTDGRKYGIHHLTNWTILKVLGNLHENGELLNDACGN